MKNIKYLILLSLFTFECLAQNLSSGVVELRVPIWSLINLLQKEEKDQAFKGFTIDDNLLKKADSDAIVLHCLPAYRNKEITDSVIESVNSRIFRQAENRMHAQQALLSCLIT